MKQEIPIFIGDSIRIDDHTYVVRRRSIKRVLYDWYWWLCVRPVMRRRGVIK
jgi:hypothetical protein